MPSNPSVAAVDNIVDDSHIVLSPAHSQQAPVQAQAQEIGLPTSRGLEHLGRGIRAMVSEPHHDAQPKSQLVARDHRVAAMRRDNRRGSRSRNQPAETHICPWDDHRWNWSCASGVEGGHRGRAKERWEDWTQMLAMQSPSC